MLATNNLMVAFPINPPALAIGVAVQLQVNQNLVGSPDLVLEVVITSVGSEIFSGCQLPP
ncbi:hypothetical protein TIFTF001_047606 [Ficus carica]|uniref:Uncharacterized protein n=1 Tax=Ficus carica TaxID=3494 RepID=A0AA87Z1V7_FICCA|nr:hypothetical protein TIFTF001_047606 [Ficus carica]